MKTPESLSRLIETIHRLRAPGGCPWDRAQTHQTLRPHLMEEAHEVLEVIDRMPAENPLADADTRAAFKEELGDLLMQVLLHSEMANEIGAFNIHDVAAGLDEKLIRRHPHVFGGDTAANADEALSRWEKQKAIEKAQKATASSALDGTPKALPSLQRATRVIEKVTKVGFQWSDMDGPLAKLKEELAEFESEVRARENAKPAAPAAREKLEAELGDLLFSLCNVGYLMKLNPEDALRSTLARFERRFRHVESRLRDQGKRPEDSTLAEMDRFWDEAKRAEKNSS